MLIIDILIMMFFASVIGIIISFLVWLIFRRFVLSALIVVFFTFLPPFMYFSYVVYMDRERSPEVHWEEEFGSPPPPEITLSKVTSDLSHERYWRSFTFQVANKAVVRSFAMQHGFVELNSDEKRTRQNLKWGNRERGFTEPCHDYLEFEADPYKGSSSSHRYDAIPSVWMRYCLSTQETYINIQM